MKATAGLPLLALITIVVAGCSQATDSDTETIGIRVSSPDGQTVMAWGNPSTPDYAGDTSSGGVHELPVGLALRNPYPNPTQTSVALSFAMQASGSARVWVEQIGFPGWLATSTKLTGATVTPGNARSVEVILDRAIEAGIHEVVWRPASGVAPTGIYRINVRTPTATEWRDVMLYHSLEELPDDLRTVVANW